MKIRRATVLELRKSIGSRSRRWLLIASGVVGLLSAGLMAFTGSAQDHTFAVISFYTQISISLPLPFVSVLQSSPRSCSQVRSLQLPEPATAF
jgi:hypothetical protein